MGRHGQTLMDSGNGTSIEIMGGMPSFDKLHHVSDLGVLTIESLETVDLYHVPGSGRPFYANRSKDETIGNSQSGKVHLLVVERQGRRILSIPGIQRMDLDRDLIVNRLFKFLRI